MNLAAPQPAVASGVGRDVLQWAVLDPTGMSLRATSRAYETNAMDHERAHIDEAIADLRQAPISGYQPGLTDDELKGVIARLELRKRLLGELLTDRAAQRAGQDAGFEQERVRSRNWELLRQFAEKTGLNFEPLGIGGSTGEYALLCFPLAGAAEPKGTALEPLWKLLNIRDPWSDPRLRQWRGPTLPDANGGSIPLGVYSMAYPKMPLLLLDFRDNLHIRRRELSQRYINEITSGIIGISHFTNWYYFVGSDIYDFVTARHGSAMDQAARLDCYSRFRMALSFDRTLAPELRAEMQRRAAAASLNPLECSPAQEMELARERYDVLLRESDNGELMRQVNRDRRAEMSAFGRSQKADTSAALLHIVTFGLYTRRVPAASLDPDHLAEERAIRADLEFLKNVINAGPMPEVSFDTDLLATKIRELGRLSQSLNVPAVDRESAAVIKRVGELSKDQTLEANCDFALHVLQGETRKVVASGVSNRLPVETGE